MNCVPSSPLAPQIKPRTLVEQRERGYFGGLIGDVLHFPVRRKHDVQQVYKDILVPLVSENSLESGIGKYVHISLHNSFSLPLYCFSDSYICFGYIFRPLMFLRIDGAVKFQMIYWPGCGKACDEMQTFPEMQTFS